jgi:hypothetical protein
VLIEMEQVGVQSGLYGRDALLSVVRIHRSAFSSTQGLQAMARRHGGLISIPCPERKAGRRRCHG